MQRKLRGIMGVSLILIVSSSAFAQETQQIGDVASSAKDSVANIEQIISDGQDMLLEARQESNVTRMDCINSQLVIARGFLNVAQNAETNLQDAASRNDQEAASHHQKLLTLAETKSEVAYSRMKQCASGVVSVSGETKLMATRKCQIEPCLEGEAYYDPSVIEQNGLIQTGVYGGSMVDASPYL